MTLDFYISVYWSAVAVASLVGTAVVILNSLKR